MQTQISTTETSLLGSGLLFETNPPDTGPIDPPDNTGGGGTTAPPIHLKRKKLLLKSE